jgi:hypothetical protein
MEHGSKDIETDELRSATLLLAPLGKVFHDGPHRL